MKRSNQKTGGRILPFRKKGNQEESVSPTEVTKDLFSDVWKDHVDGVRTMAGELKLKHPSAKLSLKKSNKSRRSSIHKLDRK